MNGNIIRSIKYMSLADDLVPVLLFMMLTLWTSVHTQKTV